MTRVRLILVFALLFSAPALAGFDEGRAAYDSKDWMNAILQLRPAAEDGDDRAMILLGNMYSQGYGVDQNGEEALSLYKRAAAKNNTDAMVAVGALYTSGEGGVRSMKTALDWYRRAAEAGNQAGAFFYASLLYRGNKSTTEDFKPDFYNAYKWYRIAATIDGGDLALRKAAADYAHGLTRLKLTPEEMLRADEDVAAWKPQPVEILSPVPTH